MNRKVRFTEDAARRVAAATLAYERSGRDQPPIRFRTASDDSGADPVRLGKTTAAWTKGTLATIELWEEGSPGAEAKKTPTADTLADCVNKFANVASGKFVTVARGPFGAWYLIAAEC